MSTPDRRLLPIADRVRNIPAAQHLLQAGGICSCFWRLGDGTPVLCAMPVTVPHNHWVEPPPDLSLRSRMDAWVRSVTRSNEGDDHG